MKSQLRKEKEPLEAEHIRFQEYDVTLQAELERVREENRLLQKEREVGERHEMGTLLEE
jgi:hypothetical protein